MNIVKHMEAIFIVTLAFAASASYVAAALPEAQAHEAHATANSIATPSRMAVVTVSAKRMNAIEKSQSLLEERIAARSST